MSDLETKLNTLFPGKEVILSTREVIMVQPFKFGQLPHALKLTQKIGGLLKEMYQAGELQNREKGINNIVYVLSEGGEDLINLIGLCISKKREWFDDVAGDDGIAITAAFMEVNVDFFTQRMLPQLMEAMKGLNTGKQT